MDIKQELMKIKSFLMSSQVTTDPVETNEEPIVTEEPTSQTFAEYETSQGIKLKIDGEVSVGVPVVIVAEDGTETKAEGEYDLIGIAKIVATDGLISEIIPMEEEPSVEVEVEMAEAPVEVVPDMTPILEERITKLEGMIEELKSKLENMTKATETMASVVEEISTLPTAEVSKPASFTYLYPKTKQDQNVQKLFQALK
jgi:hypothetical protein